MIILDFSSLFLFRFLKFSAILCYSEHNHQACSIRPKMPLIALIVPKNVTIQMSERSLSAQDCFDRIEQSIRDNPTNLEPVITEFHSLLNKWYSQIQGKDQGGHYKLTKDGFDCERVLKQIRELAQRKDLKIPQIRFKADQLSKSKRIPLPNSTRKHKEPLLQWFEINWAILA
jgi:hypothetical protein